MIVELATGVIRTHDLPKNWLCCTQGWHEDSETEFEDEVDLLMSSDIVWSHMSTKPINFTRVQSGWFFKEDRKWKFWVRSALYDAALVANFRSNVWPIFLLPNLCGLSYLMGEIVSRTEVAFCFYARSRVPIKLSLSALVALAPHLDKCYLRQDVWPKNFLSSPKKSA
jgi:hypothetical protein